MQKHAKQKRPHDLFERVKEAQATQQELRQYFLEPRISIEQIVSGALLLTRLSPSTNQMAEAYVVYLSGVMREKLQPKFFEKETQLMLEVADELMTDLGKLVGAEFIQKMAGDLNVSKSAELPISVWWQGTEDLRRVFRNRLIELKLEPTKALKRIEAEKQGLLEWLFILPLSINVNRYVWFTVEGLIGLTLSKLAEEIEYEDGLWDRLAECIRLNCSAFFLRRQGMGPPQKYCSEECRTIQHNKDSAERKRRSRAAARKRK